MSYDLIVIGGGAIGCASAYQASKAGARVLLLEQRRVAHERSSSAGRSRVIRLVYDDLDYVALARAAFEAWRTLEREADEPLLTMTGGLYFGPRDNPDVRAYFDCVRAAHLPHERLSRREAQRRYPQFQLPEGLTILTQPDTGSLDAARCVHAIARLARRHGAELREGQPVVALELGADSVRVRTAAGDRYDAARLVVAAGAWTRSLLAGAWPGLPIQPKRMQYGVFEPASPERFAVDALPIFISFLDDPACAVHYGIPASDGRGVKIASDAGTLVSDPTAVDFEPDVTLGEQLRRRNRAYLPALDVPMRPSSGRVCLYSLTPDRHPIIDRHPQHPHVVIAGGFSGHGFKFSPVMGEIVGDLALGRRPRHPTRLFCADRFDRPPGQDQHREPHEVLDVLDHGPA